VCVRARTAVRVLVRMGCMHTDIRENAHEFIHLNLRLYPHISMHTHIRMFA